MTVIDTDAGMTVIDTDAGMTVIDTDAGMTVVNSDAGMTIGTHGRLFLYLQALSRACCMTTLSRFLQTGADLWGALP
ncbi:hypothetical protein OCL06_15170 [Alteromonas sp. ASW11-19]|uniref:Uncharacterized protein n=1 Tax=Alteromonas salexigens TaxID=2982530 RepID=A0ABT2VVQ3_9ALTE|nr:hypothetical protein [Alteromonas salexigens]MCU7555929.1 hypothetical protein [Alteromonas salexigens]